VGELIFYNDLLSSRLRDINNILNDELSFSCKRYAFACAALWKSNCFSLLLHTHDAQQYCSVIGLHLETSVKFHHTCRTLRNLVPYL